MAHRAACRCRSAIASESMRIDPSNAGMTRAPRMALSSSDQTGVHVPSHPDTVVIRSPRPRRRVGWRDRLGVASRVGAALVAGYFLAHGTTAFLTLALPLGKVDRVVFASLLSFAVWCAAVVYVFAAPSAWRAWWVTSLAGAVFLGIAMLFPEMAARP